MFVFSQRSLRNLQDVHPDFVLVARRALELTTVDFIVTEGRRGSARQEQLIAEGRSWTKNSRHLTGHAIDVAAYVDGSVSWDWKYYELIAQAFKQASHELGIPIEWGGDWHQRKDGPHFQLPWKEYPA